jgi:hypothetical protein
MKSPRLIPAIAAACFALPGAAQQPSDLKQLQFEYDVQYAEEVTGPYRESIAKLNTAYRTGLDRELATAKAAGDLENALALDTEIKRLADGQALPATDEAVGPGLKKLRAIYRAELAKRDLVRLDAEKKLRGPFEAKLKEQEVRLTKAGQLAEASAVMEYRKKLGAAVATPATAAPRAAAIAPVPVPPVPETAAPLTPTIGAGGGVLVAGEIRAKAEGKDIAPGVIFFQAPKGNGRSGPKGVLLKNEADISKTGSTWTFKWTRSLAAEAVQIIHPTGQGHAILHIDSKWIALNAPETWSEINWRGGKRDAVRHSNEFDSVFPIEDDREYEVLSCLSAANTHELYIDGVLVSTGRVSRAKPLGVAGETPETKFIGDVPLEWGPNWAAVIVGPVDAGISRARELRFYPGVLPKPVRKP